MDPTWLVRLDQTLSSYSILATLVAVALLVGVPWPPRPGLAGWLAGWVAVPPGFLAAGLPEPGLPVAQSKKYGVRIIPAVLDAMGIDHIALEEPANVAALAPAIGQAYARSRPVVALIGRTVA